MPAGQVSAVLQLPATGLRVTGCVYGRIGALGAHELEQFFANIHRDLVFFCLVTVGAGDAAAACMAFA